MCSVLTDTLGAVVAWSHLRGRHTHGEEPAQDAADERASLTGLSGSEGADAELTGVGADHPLSGCTLSGERAPSPAACPPPRACAACASRVLSLAS